MLPAIPPYYHPTTVCLVDDSLDFSRRLREEIPPQINLKTFLTPEDALEFINRPHPRPALADRCFENTGGVIHLVPTVLEQEIKHPDRFERISVVLVDYAMPTMNGLEFCARVADKDIRRVLLPPTKDEKAAVDAFNRGLIEHYLPKSALAQSAGITPYIRDQQAFYFRQYLKRLTRGLGLPPPLFLHDAKFYEYFQALLNENAIVEYFFVTDPNGFLLLTAYGTIKQVIIEEATASDIDNKIAILEAFTAPDDLINQCKQREALVFFFEHPEDYLGNEPFPWHDVVFPAERIEGQTNWLCAVIENPPTDIDFDAEQSCYDEFLEQRQRREQAPG